MKIQKFKTFRTDKGLYERAIETPSNIYFINFSEKAQKRMVREYDRRMTLLHEDRAAYIRFTETLDSKKYLWINKKVSEKFGL
jgi:hypothetical protein